jgi:hypothetical protein
MCGAYLSSSDEDCDHDGMSVEKHLFREIDGGRDSLVGVECCLTRAWHRLQERVGDDWIGYEYLGTKAYVVDNINAGLWDDVASMPRKSMALSAPDDIPYDEEE